MDYMAGLPDKAFDLAIVDPPYGISHSIRHGGKECRNKKVTSIPVKWDVAPPPEYFQELFRVSKEQIVWGGNYFKETRERGAKFISWYKCVDSPNTVTVANVEYAWTSSTKAAHCFAIKRHSNFVWYRLIHPTQKPILLYRKLLEFYAKPDWRILDTHGGSFSSAVAAHELGYEYVGIELDEDYYEKGVARLREVASQSFLIEPRSSGTPRQVDFAV
jgi:site-specific DNA-methyltransferase (adenine-specific)